jgi:hypothetical protein
MGFVLQRLNLLFVLVMDQELSTQLLEEREAHLIVMTSSQSSH